MTTQINQICFSTDFFHLLRVAAQKNTIKTLRIPDSIVARVKRVAAACAMDEAEIYRQVILAGLERIESGDFNPFSLIKKPKK